MLKEQFFNTYKFSNHDKNNLIVFFFFLQQTIYPYEYMDEENKTSLTEKEDFYSDSNMENITDVDYVHAKRICKDFEIRGLGEYDKMYVQKDTLLSADLFENFRNMGIKIYKLDISKFLSNARLAWQAALKRTK